MTREIPDYRSMWAQLGLDLDKHDALLGVLGEAYQSLFLGQPNRPEGMSQGDVGQLQTRVEAFIEQIRKE